MTTQQEQLAFHFISPSAFALVRNPYFKVGMLFNTEEASRTIWREFWLVLGCFNWHLASGRMLGLVLLWTLQSVSFQIESHQTKIISVTTITLSSNESSVCLIGTDSHCSIETTVSWQSSSRQCACVTHADSLQSTLFNKTKLYSLILMESCREISWQLAVDNENTIAQLDRPRLNCPFY